ncbi:tRNA ligase [Irineochytrium annulatum]|nr:tRNA ligase [Irineochytrium annulatum]
MEEAATVDSDATSLNAPVTKDDIVLSSEKENEDAAKPKRNKGASRDAEPTESKPRKRSRVNVANDTAPATTPEPPKRLASPKRKSASGKADDEELTEVDSSPGVKRRKTSKVKVDESDTEVEVKVAKRKKTAMAEEKAEDSGSDVEKKSSRKKLAKAGESGSDVEGKASKKKMTMADKKAENSDTEDDSKASKKVKTARKSAWSDEEVGPTAKPLKKTAAAKGMSPIPTDSGKLVISDLEEKAGWKAGESVPYAVLCQVFEQMEATTKRLEITSLLCKFFTNVILLSPQCLVECVYLCVNKVYPEYLGKELGLGESTLVKAVAQSTSRTADKIKEDLKTIGDLGTIAETIDRKISMITGLLSDCTKSEVKFFVRSLEGKLRIGLAERTVIIALAQSFVYAEQSKYLRMLHHINGCIAKKARVPSDKLLSEAVNIVKQVYCQMPNYELLIPALIDKGVTELPNSCKLTPGAYIIALMISVSCALVRAGVPLKPMLAHPTKSITEVLNRFENVNFVCEYKYDGERAQVHLLEDGTVSVFSRNSENLSLKYPDIVELVPGIFSKEKVTSFVLDCEAVAWDKEKNLILPFQVLSTRKRKDVSVGSISVSVCLYAFDLLYLNGKALVTETLRTRRDLLQKNFNKVDGKFNFAISQEASTVDTIQTFLDESVVNNCEGLMVKTLDADSSYEPSVRSRNWLKVKKDYISGVGDSLDLVVIGGYYGRGKRTGWYGGFLLACRDEESDGYQSICKIGTGFSEENFKDFSAQLSEGAMATPPSYYSIGALKDVPDVWFKPVQVWEVKAADLSISPGYQAGVGLVDPGKGISLRFPRFIRVRDDKDPSDATNSDQVATMYRAQKINHGAGLKSAADDEYD